MKGYILQINLTQTQNPIPLNPKLQNLRIDVGKSESWVCTIKKLTVKKRASRCNNYDDFIFLIQILHRKPSLKFNHNKANLI